MTDFENVLNILDEPLDYVTQNLEVSMSIEASAGCGKTYTLIARVIELLKSGRTTIDRIVMLTFTENAAAEMKSRLVEMLTQNNQSNWAKNALENLHLATIVTIHSFAFEICRSFHDSLGLPSEISIADDTDQQNQLSSFFNTNYNQWANQPELLSFFQVCRHLKINRSAFNTSFQEVLRNIVYIPGDVVPELDTSPDEFNDVLKIQSKNVRECAQTLNRLCACIDKTQLTTKPLGRVLAFSDLAKAIANTDSDVELFAVVKQPEKYIKSKGFEIKISATFSPEYSEIEAEISKLGEQIKLISSSVADAALRLSVRFLYSLATTWRDTVFSSGRITFDDSIIAARRAIELDAIREQLWKRTDCVIVDEFQDTDIHQLSILDALADDQSQGDLARIFVVGDDKQSIYGFRGATVDGYKDFIRTRPITRVALSRSRRTVPSIVSLINHVSESILPEYTPMQTVRNDISDAPDYHVKIIGGGSDDNVEQIRLQQAQDVVDCLASMNGHAQIFDKMIGQERSCTFSDMAILIRNKSSLPSLITQLDAKNIPYALESSSLIWDLTMMRSFLAIATAIAEPRNGFAIVGALRTPVFNATNDDLVTFVKYCKSTSQEPKNKNYWDYRNPHLQDLLDSSEDGSTKKVLIALSRLKDLHDTNNFRRPSELVDYLLYETGLYQSYVLALGPSLTTTVSRFLLSNAIAYEDSHPLSSAHEYIDYLIQNRENSSKTDSPLETTAHNKIKILTIHSSKGLEFPIVGFIPSLSGARPLGVKIIAQGDSFDADAALAISSTVFDTRLSDYKDALRDTFLEEESRLAYVAMTRAQDHLVLSTHHQKSKTNNQAGLLGLATAGLDRYSINESGSLEQDPTHHQARISSIGEISDQTYGQRQNKLHSRELLYEKILSSQYVNATGMKPNDLIEAPIKERKNQFLSDNVAPAIGKTVHRVMNIIDFSADDETISLLCKRCGANEGISAETEIKKCITMVKRALAIPLFLESNIEIIREAPISGKILGHQCEGYIDCLVKSSSGYTIIDYKTDSIDKNRPLEEKVQRHSFQLAFYSLLLKQALNFDRCDAALVFLDAQTQALVPINDLDKYEKQVLAQLHKISR